MIKTAKNLTRREFIRYAAQFGISAVALERLIHIGSKAYAAQEDEQDSKGSAYRWAMAIDLDVCTGCNYCTYACRATNDTAPGITWNTVFEDRETFSKDVYIPRPCMHCEHAPCVEVCPVQATYHRPDGLVAMDYDRCIGCRYCQVACPYGARYFNWETNTQPNPMAPEWGSAEIERRPRGVAEKCTFCAQRIDAGLARGLRPGSDPAATPACVNICPVGARIFGDLNDPNSTLNAVLASRETVVLREDLGTHPRVFYLLPKRSTQS